jgi:hypothetical protein
VFKPREVKKIMQAKCTSCLYLKKVPGQMFVFCKMNRLPTSFEISRGEFTKAGVIRLTHRRLFDVAKACPTFVNMEEEEEITAA